MVQNEIDTPERVQTEDSTGQADGASNVADMSHQSELARLQRQLAGAESLGNLVEMARGIVDAHILWVKDAAHSGGFHLYEVEAVVSRTYKHPTTGKVAQVEEGVITSLGWDGEQDDNWGLVYMVRDAADADDTPRQWHLSYIDGWDEHYSASEQALIEAHAAQWQEAKRVRNYWDLELSQHKVTRAGLNEARRTLDQQSDKLREWLGGDDTPAKVIDAKDAEIARLHDRIAQMQAGIIEMGNALMASQQAEADEPRGVLIVKTLHQNISEFSVHDGPPVDEADAELADLLNDGWRVAHEHIHIGLHGHLRVIRLEKWDYLQEDPEPTPPLPPLDDDPDDDPVDASAWDTQEIEPLEDEPTGEAPVPADEAVLVSAARRGEIVRELPHELLGWPDGTSPHMPFEAAIQDGRLTPRHLEIVGDTELGLDEIFGAAGYYDLTNVSMG